MRRLNQAMAGLLFAGLALSGGGCSTNAVNPDFNDALTLDVLTLSHKTEFSPNDRIPASARYILLADGTLHAQSPAVVGTMTMPPRVRRLDGREREEIAMLAAAAMGDETVNEPPIDLESLHPPREGTLIAVIRTAAGERRLRRTIQSDDQSNPQIAALVDALAMLAWAGERPVVVEPGPVRYDLGPDPYARYRRGE